MKQVVLTPTWQTVTVAGTRAIAQAFSGELFLGTTAPVATDAGLRLVNNIPIYIDPAVFTVIAVRGTGVAVFTG